MKILYMSVHEILEYDELKLFTELGHECYSLGAYTNPYGESGRKRPPIPEMPFDPHFSELSVRYSKDDLHPEMIEDKDVIIVMHEPSFIIKNWDKIKHKRVIWRSIGQSIPKVERMLEPYRLEGLQVVRYSPREMTIKDNIGADATIRFYKDPDEFKDWNGSSKEVVTFAQSMKSRGSFLNFDMFEQVTRPFPRKLYGPNNEDAGELSGGLLSYEDMKQKMRDARVYFYTGTHPASYTLNLMEAMMTGCPIVAIGSGYGNSKDFPDQQTYEIPDIIYNGVSGYQNDDPEQLTNYIRLLMDDDKLAKHISFYGRQRAIELFGKETVKKQWKTFL